MTDYKASDADGEFASSLGMEPMLSEGRFPGTQKGSFYFDNTCYFDLGRSSYVNNAGRHLTVLAWVNLSGFNGSYMNHAWVFGSTDTGGYSLLVGGSGTTACVAQSAVGLDYVDSLPAFPLNTWTQIGFTLDGTTCRFYVNGKFVNSRAYGRIFSTGFRYTIGSRDYGNPLNGYIDELAVWDRILDDSEISAFYENGRP